MAIWDDLSLSDTATGDVARAEVSNPPMAGEFPAQTDARREGDVINDQRAQLRAAQTQRQQQLDTDRTNTQQQRMTGAAFAAQGVPSFRDTSGAVTPVTDEQGGLLTHHDKKNSLAWDSLGNPRALRNEPGAAPGTPPTLADPLEGVPTTTTKSGDQYKIVPGMEWQWVGQDEDIAAKNAQALKEQEISKAATAIGGKLSLDQHAAITAKVDFHTAQKQFNAITSKSGLTPQTGPGAAIVEGLANNDPDTAHGALDTHFNTLYGADAANATSGLFSSALSPEATALRGQLDQDKAAAHEALNKMIAAKARADGAQARMEQTRAVAEDLQTQRTNTNLQHAGLPALSGLPPETQTQVANALPPGAQQVLTPPQVTPRGQVQPEGFWGTAARAFGTKILPGVATAVGGTAAGLAAVETGPFAIAADIAGGAAAGASADALQRKLIMGEAGAKANDAQMAANAKAHPYADQLGGMIPFLISMLGGGGTAGLKVMGKVLGRAEAAPLTAAGKAAMEEAAAKGTQLLARDVPMVERVASGAAQGARAGAAEGAEEKYAEGKDVSVLDQAARGAVGMGAVSLFPASKSLLVNVFGKSATDAAAMTLASSLYDAGIHGTPFDIDKTAKEMGANYPAFVVQNALLGFFHIGMQKAAQGGGNAPGGGGNPQPGGGPQGGPTGGQPRGTGPKGPQEGPTLPNVDTPLPPPTPQELLGAINDRLRQIDNEGNPLTHDQEREALTRQRDALQQQLDKETRTQRGQKQEEVQAELEERQAKLPEGEAPPANVADAEKRLLELRPKMGQAMIDAARGRFSNDPEAHLAMLHEWLGVEAGTEPPPAVEATPKKEEPPAVLTDGKKEEPPTTTPKAEEPPVKKEEPPAPPAPAPKPPEAKKPGAPTVTKELTEDEKNTASALDDLLDAEPTPPASEPTTPPTGAAPLQKKDKDEPTPAQLKAGNYPKGHDRIAGMDVSVENRAGTTRKSKDPEHPWEVQMQDDYGYIRGTMGRDKDHLDVFVKPGTPEDYSGPVFVVNQTKLGNKEGKYDFDDQFDEHKVILGAKTPEEAREIYQRNYTQHTFAEGKNIYDPAKGYVPPGYREAGVATFKDVDSFKKWAFAPGRRTKELMGSTPPAIDTPEYKALGEGSLAQTAAWDYHRGEAPSPLPWAEKDPEGHAAFMALRLRRHHREKIKHAERYHQRRIEAEAEAKLSQPASVETPTKTPQNAGDKKGTQQTHAEEDGEPEGKTFDKIPPMPAVLDEEQPRHSENPTGWRAWADAHNNYLDKFTVAHLFRDKPEEQVLKMLEDFKKEHPEQWHGLVRRLRRRGFRLAVNYKTETMAKIITERVKVLDEAIDSIPELRQWLIDFHDRHVDTARNHNGGPLVGPMAEGASGQEEDPFNEMQNAFPALAFPTAPVSMPWVYYGKKAAIEGFDKWAYDQGFDFSDEDESPFVPQGTKATSPGAVAYQKAHAWLQAQEKAGEKIGRYVDALGKISKLRNDSSIENDMLALLRNADVEDVPLLAIDGDAAFDQFWDDFREAMNKGPAKAEPKHSINHPAKPPTVPSPISAEKMEELGKEYGRAFDDAMDEYYAALGETVTDEPPERVSAEDVAKEKGQELTQEDATKRVEAWKRFAKNLGDKPHGDDSNPNHGKTILSLFDSTGVWSKPFRDAGFNVVQIDMELVDGFGMEEDVMNIDPEWLIDNGLDDIHGVLAACPCTEFSGSGARWWAEKDADGRTAKARALVNHTLAIIEWLKPDFWAIENPVGRLKTQTEIPGEALQFQPHNYGDAYTKRTQIFGHFNPHLPQANVEPPIDPESGEKKYPSYAHDLRGDNPEEHKARSNTFEGFAYAFFMANYQHGPEGYVQKALEGKNPEDDTEEQTEPDPFYAATLFLQTFFRRATTHEKRMAWLKDIVPAKPGQEKNDEERDRARWMAIRNTYVTARAAEQAVPGKLKDVMLVQIHDKRHGEAGKHPVVDAIFVPRDNLRAVTDQLERIYPASDYEESLSPSVAPYTPKKGEPTYEQWKAGREWKPDDTAAIPSKKGEWTPGVQAKYAKLKGKLTKAINDKKPLVVISQAIDAQKYFESVGAYPDDWDRWVCAADDAALAEGIPSPLHEPFQNENQTAPGATPQTLQPKGPAGAGGKSVQKPAHGPGGAGRTDERPEQPAARTPEEVEAIRAETLAPYAQFFADHLITVRPATVVEAEKILAGIGFKPESQALIYHPERLEKIAAVYKENFAPWLGRGWSEEASHISDWIISEKSKVEYGVPQAHWFNAAPEPVRRLMREVYGDYGDKRLGIEMVRMLDQLVKHGDITESYVPNRPASQLITALMDWELPEDLEGHLDDMRKLRDPAKAAEPPSVPEPATVERWTQEDIEKMLAWVKEGKKLFVGGDSLPGVPAFQSLPNMEHKGYGLFATHGDGWSGTVDGGGSMSRFRDGGPGYTILSEDKGSAPYDKAGVIAALEGYLKPSPTLKAATAEQGSPKTQKQKAVAKPKAAPKPTLDAGAQKLKDKLGDLFGASDPLGIIHGSDPLAGQVYDAPVPKEYRAKLGEVVAELIDEVGVDTPEKLATSLSQLPPKARTFTQAIWFRMKSEGATGPAEPAWGTIYAALAQPEEEPTVPEDGTDAANRPDAESGDAPLPDRPDRGEHEGGGRGASGGAGGKRKPETHPDDAGDLDVSDGEEPSGERGGKTGGAGDRDARVGDSANPGGNLRLELSDGIGAGGLKTKFRENVAAIHTLRAIESEGREATAEEQKILARYVGWGGLAEKAFQPGGEFYDEMQALGLSDDEMASARRSTTNAHYTSGEIIQGMWAAARKMGFDGGKVTENSMGVGHFFGFMPLDLAHSSRLTGIEMDNLTARIARVLYPEAKVWNRPFEKHVMADNSQDVVIGNFPFSDRDHPNDARYNQINPNLHDYFFLKSIDKVRPGGFVIAITSMGTMDKLGADVREVLSAKANLVAAFRLPSNAFKGNASTDVTTDLIILQKRGVGVKTEHTDWLNPVEYQVRTGNEVRINQYFRDHPEQMLGTMTTEGSMFASDQKLDPSGRPIGSKELKSDGRTAAQIAEAIVAGVPRGIYVPADEQQSLIQNADELEFDPNAEKDGSFVMDGQGGVKVFRAGALERPRKEITPNSKRHEQLAGYHKAGFIRIEENGDVRATGLKWEPTTDKGELKLREEIAAGNISGDVYKSFEEYTVVDPNSPPGAPRMMLAEREVNTYAFEGDYTKADYERIKQLIPLRRAMKAVLHAQVVEVDDAALARLQKDLTVLYDTYVKENGYMDEGKTRMAFNEDPFYPALLALEERDASSNSVYKTDIFTKRTRPRREPLTELTGTTRENMLRVMAKTGRVNIELQAQLSLREPDELADELAKEGLVFRDATTGEYVEREEYLSGNIYEKLAAAKAALEVDPAFQPNVDELTKAIPELRPAERIGFQLGANWIPPATYEAFIRHLFGDDAMQPKVTYKGGRWAVADVERSVYVGAGLDSSVEGFEGLGPSAGSGKGHRYFTTRDLMEMAMNMQSPVAKDPVEDSSPVTNVEATELCKQAQERLKNEFQNWVLDKPDIHTPLVASFNEKFNAIKAREYHAPYERLEGMNPEITLNQHQLDGAWRFTVDGKGTMAWVVGSGKTYGFIGTGMEWKRLGMASKVMYCVPNHLLRSGQTAADFYRMYPTAKILTVTAKDFTAKRRQRLMARIATGNWDAVLIGHSQIGLIPVSPDLMAAHIQVELQELEEALRAVKAEVDPNSRQGKKRIKQLEGDLAAKRSQMEKLLDPRRADKALYFEELGVDAIILDEAHEFKNLNFWTKLNNVGGLGSANSDTQKTAQLKVKTDYILRQNNGRNVLFATGTPVSNTIAEVYLLQKYLAQDLLDAAGIKYFDEWAATFAKVEEVAQISPDGQTMQNKTKFSRFKNMQSLIPMFRRYVDIQRQEQLKLPVPNLVGGKIQNMVFKPVPYVQEYMAEVVERAEALRGGRVDPRVDNWLKLNTDARKVTTDPRLMDAEQPDDDNYKSSQVALNAYKVWKANDYRKGTQVIFCDLFSNKVERPRLDAWGEPVRYKGRHPKAGEPIVDVVEVFNVFTSIKDRLIRMGVPEAQIAVINDYEKDEDKEQLKADLNSGKIRFLLGTRMKMATGMNIQRRIVAVWNIDCPYRPDQITQGEGRGIRQGNLFHEVTTDTRKAKGRLAYQPNLTSSPDIETDNEDKLKIKPGGRFGGFELLVVRCAIERSLDARMFQTLTDKTRSIEDIMSGEFDGDETEDIGDAILTGQEMIAAASGNPLIMERFKLENEVRQLGLGEQEHNRRQDRIKREIGELKESIATNKDAADAVDPVRTQGDIAEKARAVRQGELVEAKREELNAAAPFEAETPFVNRVDKLKEGTKTVVVGTEDHKMTLEAALKLPLVQVKSANHTGEIQLIGFGLRGRIVRRSKRITPELLRHDFTWNFAGYSGNSVDIATAENDADPALVAGAAEAVQRRRDWIVGLEAQNFVNNNSRPADVQLDGEHYNDLKAAAAALQKRLDDLKVGNRLALSVDGVDIETRKEQKHNLSDEEKKAADETGDVPSLYHSVVAALANKGAVTRPAAAKDAREVIENASFAISRVPSKATLLSRAETEERQLQIKQDAISGPYPEAEKLAQKRDRLAEVVRLTSSDPHSHSDDGDADVIGASSPFNPLTPREQKRLDALRKLAAKQPLPAPLQAEFDQLQAREYDLGQDEPATRTANATQSLMAGLPASRRGEGGILQAAEADTRAATRAAKAQRRLARQDEEQAALKQWAAAEGLLSDKEPAEGRDVDKEGERHFIFYNGSMPVEKVTKDAPLRVEEYLRSLILANHIFGDMREIERVAFYASGNISIVTSQPFRPGVEPNPEEIAQEMGRLGFTPVTGQAAYRRGSMEIYNAQPEHWIKDENGYLWPVGVRARVVRVTDTDIIGASNPLGKAKEIGKPITDAARQLAEGAQSLLLPSMKSPDHLDAAEVLGAKLGGQQRRAEATAERMEPAWMTFERLGVRRAELTDGQWPVNNPGIQFMSDMSTGRAMSAEMQAIADQMDDEDAKRIALLRKAGVPLQTIRQDYFPGVWTQESRRAFNLAMEEARTAGIIPMGTGVNATNRGMRKWVRDRVNVLLAEGKGSDTDALSYLTKRPFKGKESFRKQKLFDGDIATAFEFGLRPISYNPVDLKLLKWAEMDRNIMAAEALAAWKARGQMKTITAYEDVPEGWTKVADKFGTIYGAPTMAEREYVDKAIWDGLMAAAKRLGLDMERVFRAGRGRLGYAVNNPEGTTVSQFATELSVLAHEISHQLDFKYGLWKKIVLDAVGIGKSGKQTKEDSARMRAKIQRELRALADLSWEGQTNVSGYFKEYVRKRAEKMAHLLEVYMHARERFRDVAPTVFAEFEQFLNDNPELKPLIDVKPGVSLQRLDNERYVGLRILGYRIVRQPVADVLNNYLSQTLYNNPYAGKTYTMWMTLANVLNQTQLGVGSFFHAGFTTLEAQVSAGANVLKDVFGLLRGNRSRDELLATLKNFATAAVETATTGHKVVKEYRNPSLTPQGQQQQEIAQIAKAVELAGGGFTLERGMKTNQTHKLVSDWLNDHKVRAAVRSPIAFLELCAWPLMQGLVPRQKAGVFAHMARRIIEQNPGKTMEELTPEFRAAWNRVDARLGQVRYDRLFMANVAKNIIQALVRAPGWTAGTMAELGGGFKDMFAGGGSGGSGGSGGGGRGGEGFFHEWHRTGKVPENLPDRTAYLLSLLLLIGTTNALLSYLFTGEQPNALDYWAFRTGAKDETGRDERMVLPTYMKDLLSYVKDPWTTLINKAHPIVSLVGDLFRNKDYYGVQIRPEDAKAWEKVLDSGKYIAKAFVPFWMRGAAREHERGGGVAKLALPLVGVMPAPKKMTQTAAERMADDYAHDSQQVGGRTAEQAAASAEKYKVVEQLRKGQTPDYSHVPAKDIPQIVQRAHETPLQYQVKKLSLDKAEAVYRAGNPAEQRQLAPILEGMRGRAAKKLSGAAGGSVWSNL